MSADDSDSHGLGDSSLKATSSKERNGDVFSSDASKVQEPINELPRASSWADLDLSIVVALVAPIVNWLTGSDHLKNLFLILFLVIYLHQLIQVPWELYHTARRRRPHPSFRNLNLPEHEESVIKGQARMAETELQRHEIAYLLISIITPFAGAALLRFILKSIGGVDSISWFSTTLFVLATGVRPWAHLVSRLRERTALLHDAVHYPSPDTQLIADSRLKSVVDRMDKLEQELTMVKRAMAMRAYVEDIHEELRISVDDTERALRKVERKAESSRASNDTRFANLEKAVSRIERTRGERVRLLVPGHSAPSSPDGDTYGGPGSIVDFPFRFLRALINALTFDYFDSGLTPTVERNSQTPMPARPPIYHVVTPTRLETIKEDASEPAGTAQDDDDPTSDEADDEAPRRRRRSDSDPAALQKKAIGHKQRTLVEVTADIVTLPYRLAIAILLAVSPPFRRFFV
ncbi:hypothetical protein BC834DRAFT_818930 [Gloeopeniophorella convolvens]|nr:hypothetical protein BC834DRAFT_818930 [Gloeopeniophorella convolvens]